MTPEPVALEVVYEDEQLIVVVKPAGVLVHPTLGVKRGTLANALVYHLNRPRIAEPGLKNDESQSRDVESAAVSGSQAESGAQHSFVRPGIVHRLDRDTSGLLVVAKTRDALSRLSQHFQRRLVEKRYVAVVAGRVEADEQSIVAPIGRDAEARPAWRVAEDGKRAETRLRVLERGARRTLLELEPVTGRTNQLRIHCAHVGHAIVGDRLYAGDEHARLCLHASRLAFRHPATNAWTEFLSPPPAEIVSALA
jgi:23S rRNA pseudouridine1911/1915/1917 synthase